MNNSPGQVLTDLFQKYSQAGLDFVDTSGGSERISLDGVFDLEAIAEEFMELMNE